MVDNHRVILYARDVPPPESDPSPVIYFMDKWDDLDEALEADADVIAVAFPEVLGDTYTEVVVNLGKLASSGKRLLIAHPSPWLRPGPEVGL